MIYSSGAIVRSVKEEPLATKSPQALQTQDPTLKGETTIKGRIKRNGASGCIGLQLTRFSDLEDLERLPLLIIPITLKPLTTISLSYKGHPGKGRPLRRRQRWYRCRNWRLASPEL